MEKIQVAIDRLSKNDPDKRAGRTVLIQKVIGILARINRYIQASEGYLQGNDGTKNDDPIRFENDLKYFREWFRLREQKNSAKYDYFYGPLQGDEETAIKTNKERKKKQARVSAPKESGRRSLDGNGDSALRGSVKSVSISRIEGEKDAYETQGEY